MQALSFKMGSKRADKWFLCMTDLSFFIVGSRNHTCLLLIRNICNIKNIKENLCGFYVIFANKYIATLNNIKYAPHVHHLTLSADHQT